MAYFPDLSEYTYSDDRPERPEVSLNVGWLAAGHSFSTDKCPAEFIACLRKLAKSPVAVMRGLHWCELCPPPNDYDETPRGTGEIRVRGAEQRIYAAPTLIVHYVEAHKYRPPDEFIAAVLDSKRCCERGWWFWRRVRSTDSSIH